VYIRRPQVILYGPGRPVPMPEEDALQIFLHLVDRKVIELR
jgi:hypothetical protein